MYQNSLRSSRVNEKREFFELIEEELMYFFDLIDGKDVTSNKEFFESPEDKVAYEKHLDLVKDLISQLLESSRVQLLLS